ncbi:MAG TPA: DUF4118 domain-containing protein, partial [Spirochaetia bacterium]|nr:DUF4118 domain-containing protein [Spirochaetia bacterium]
MEIARTFGVDWIAVHVQTPSSETSSEANRQRAIAHLQLAEKLGARVEEISGADVTSAIVEYAARNDVTRIVVGKMARRGLRRGLRPGVAARLVRRSGTIDVYVIQGEQQDTGPGGPIFQGRPYFTYPIISVLAAAAATGIGSLFDKGTVATANVVMVYLLATFSVSIFVGWIAGLMTSILGVLAFNFFFTQPYFTLAVDDPQYLVTFAVMIAVTVGSSSLAARVRFQTVMSRGRELRTRRLYDLSRKLTEANGEERVCAVAREELSELLDCDAVVATTPRLDDLIQPEVVEAARWCARNGQPVGAETANFTDIKALLLPLQGRREVLGVIALTPSTTTRRVLTDDPALFAGLTSLIAFAIDRERASVEARDRLLEVENEKMRNALLRGISHDLRTPLAAISGSATTLLHGPLDPASSRDLIDVIAQEAEWMSRVVENMLRATRLEAEGLQLAMNMEPVDDLVASTVDRLTKYSPSGKRGEATANIRVSLPEELVVVPMDLPLMQQVLINILD